MRRSVAEQLAAQPPIDTTDPASAPKPESVWDPKQRRMTNAEVIERLETAPESKRVPGRTLLKGHMWDGRDLPGHGSAAKRRLRQMANGQHGEAKR